MKDKFGGKRGTPEREAMEAKLKEEVNTYIVGDMISIDRQPYIVAFMGLSDDMVEMLFVLPPEKGKGYGSSLLDFAFTKKHIRKIDVNEQNTEAYQFYLRQGYKVPSKDCTDADGKPYPIIHLQKQ